MTEPSRPTLVIGEALIDVVRRADGSVDEIPGGSPANVALGLARLGHPVVFATQIGDDERGRAISEHLTADGVDLAPGSVTARPTSVAVATLDSTGAASYDFEITWERFTQLPREGIAHVHAGSIATTLPPGAESVLEHFGSERERATMSYDPNARPSLMGNAVDVVPTVEKLVGLSDVVKASDEDAEWLYPGVPLPEVLQRWSELGPALTIATRGGSGVLVRMGAEGSTSTFTAAKVDVVDTVGAGDSFMSGLLSGLLDDGYLGGPEARDRLRRATVEDVRPAIERALACAAITVSRAGADPPRRDELVR
jgi:fructokinase